MLVAPLSRVVPSPRFPKLLPPTFRLGGALFLLLPH
jgi:hypothetical protein